MKKYVIGLLLIPLFYLPSYISNDLLLKLSKEDSLYENASAIFFLLTAIAFFILATRPKLYIAFKNGSKYPQRKYFWLLALLFFFAFGEEISWGQRIFNFETPDAIKGNNIQEEFNFHNLKGFDGRSEDDGKDETGIMALFAMHRLFYLAFLTYLLFIPIFYSMNAKFKSFIDKIHLPVPSIMLGVFFAFNLAYGNTLRALIDGMDGHGIVEIKECVFAFILFILPLSWMRYKSLEKAL